MECPPSLIVFSSSILESMISVLGVFTNLLCFIVFSKIIQHEHIVGNMFKYLLVKAFCDCANCFGNIFIILYNCEWCGTAHTYWIQLYYIWIYNYTESITNLCSSMFEIAATFDCLITINNKWPVFQTKKCFYIVSLVIFLYCISFYVYIPLNGTIIEDYTFLNASNYTNKVRFTVKWSQTDFYEVDVIIRDAVVLVALIVLNVLIFISIKRAAANKRRISGRDNVQAQKASQRKAKMIEAMTCCFFWGHVTFFFYNLLYNSLSSVYSFFDCLNYLSYVPIEASYAFSIVLYYHFNKACKRYFLQKFC